MCETITVDVITIRRYKVKLTNYQWAVGSGRFEGTKAQYAAHMGAMSAPDATTLSARTISINVIEPQ